MTRQRTYMCIDLKSFYASVECVDMGLDPLKADLVVADPERTERTICLAVTPHLKAQGVRNRCRVYEIPKNLKYIMARPRMARYIEVSSRIYGIYLKYVSKDDIHVYSIDEVFMDVTDYMGARRMDPKQFARMIMKDILDTTGITATCGIGTNLYLAKIALDIISKHADDHIGILDEETYIEKLWDHRPLEDFWQIGTGTTGRLGRYGIYTMRGIAYADMANPELLYRIFGINAELLIDHAWGRETATIADIKAYRPKSNSLSSGQVLHEGYDRKGARLLVMEMAEQLSLDLARNLKCASGMSIYLGYSFRADVPPAKGTISFAKPTSSTRKILEYTGTLYDRIAVRDIDVYRVCISLNRLSDEEMMQYDIFSSAENQDGEKNIQRAIIAIKEKYGKNSIFKGMNLCRGARTLERNMEIGGHRA